MKNRGILPILICVIGLLVLGGVVYYYFAYGVTDTKLPSYDEYAAAHEPVDNAEYEINDEGNRIIDNTEYAKFETKYSLDDGEMSLAELEKAYLGEIEAYGTYHRITSENVDEQATEIEITLEFNDEDAEDFLSDAQIVIPQNYPIIDSGSFSNGKITAKIKGNVIVSGITVQLFGVSEGVSKTISLTEMTEE